MIIFRVENAGRNSRYVVADTFDGAIKKFAYELAKRALFVRTMIADEEPTPAQVDKEILHVVSCDRIGDETTVAGVYSVRS